MVYSWDFMSNANSVYIGKINEIKRAKYKKKWQRLWSTC